LHALDRFEQDYRRKHQDHDGLGSTGESLHILKQEVKSQNKHVKSLKKRSLWSKNLEEVIEKLVDIVHFLDLEIYDAFGYAGISPYMSALLQEFMLLLVQFDYGYLTSHIYALP
jgi:hypothetical protein